MGRFLNTKFGNICCGFFVFFSFLLFVLLSVKIIILKSQVGPYSLSMSAGNVNIDFIPTNEAKVYQKASNITVSNTCPYGATITIGASGSSTAMTQTVSGKTYQIPATSSSDLSLNSWGYSITNGDSWLAMPLNSSPATIYNSSAQATSKSVPISYGIKANSTLTSGAYRIDLIYTITPKSGCYSYNINWDMAGGTKKSGVTYPASKGWNETINLSTTQLAAVIILAVGVS